MERRRTDERGLSRTGSHTQCRYADLLSRSMQLGDQTRDETSSRSSQRMSVSLSGSGDALGLEKFDSPESDCSSFRIDLRNVEIECLDDHQRLRGEC